jgi:hypothetical protein
MSPSEVSVAIDGEQHGHDHNDDGERSDYLHGQHQKITRYINSTIYFPLVEDTLGVRYPDFAVDPMGFLAPTRGLEAFLAFVDVALFANLRPLEGARDLLLVIWTVAYPDGTTTAPFWSP